ncbi:hypothetical protein EDC01DRAFT_715714 [Geopyxis carbonaria]|nr:hypothetical protein EDC01DRAFT_715714 [Geopyxis carbonaria]
MKDSSSPTSAILSLSGEDKTSSRKSPAVASVRKLNPVPAKPNPGDFEDLTELAYRIISHPNVFITPSILESFVTLQSITRDPAPIPAAFSLYSTKPTLSSSGREKKPNPSAAKNSIPERAALAGLESAIDNGDIYTALDIIDTSYGAPAFRRSKFIRKALPFCVTATAAPIALWIAADKMAWWQDTVDHSMATNYAFLGLSTYTAVTVSLGLVALTTSNDQMVRVTWVPGTPLRERWIREEERAALDAVAMAWGFADKNKQGLEEGEEWELLREVVGRKGMILDNPVLMDGMQ